MAIPIQVTFDCADPDRLARFWAEALGYLLPPPAEGVPPATAAIVDPAGAGPRLFFQRVPEPKTVKNRVHLDLKVGGQGVPLAERRARVEAVVERLVRAGAARLCVVETPSIGDYFVVMQDPEGNEFCVD